LHSTATFLCTALVEGVTYTCANCGVITGVRYLQAHTSDLKLVPPIAGAFWTPKKPPPYDPSLPAYPVTYSEEEKAAQREAYDKHAQGVKDAIAGGKSEYTFPPGVYRSREKITLEVRRRQSPPPSLAIRMRLLHFHNRRL